MSKNTEVHAIELGMRVLEIVRARAATDQHFLMCELAETLRDRFGVSRATAFRHIRLAMDVLGIPYTDGPARRQRRATRAEEGKAMATWSHPRKWNGAGLRRKQQGERHGR